MYRPIISFNSLYQLLQSQQEVNIRAIIAIYDAASPQNKLLLSRWMVNEIQKGSTLMHWLAALGEVSLFNMLLTQGASYNGKDGAHNRPIHYAVANRQTLVLQVILEKDASMALNLGQLQMHQLSGAIYTDRTSHLTPMAISVNSNDDFSFNLMDNYQKTAFRAYLFMYYPSSFSPSPMPILDTHNWSEPVFKPEATWITQPTGQIVTVDNDGSIQHRWCSGAYLGHQYFLTEGHCISQVCAVTNLAPGSYKVSFNYEYPNLLGSKPCGAIHEHVYDIISVEAQGQCDGDGDFAIFKLNHSILSSAQKAITLSARIFNGESVVVSHHPHGLPKKVSYGQIQTQLDAVGKIEHSAHTLKGSSGSPIGSTTIPHRVLAVHVEGDEVSQSFHRGVTVKKIADDLFNSKPTLVLDLMKNSILFDWCPTPPQQPPMNSPSLPAIQHNNESIIAEQYLLPIMESIPKSRYSHKSIGNS